MILNWEFQILGILIVLDLLVMWFKSGFPALLTHLLTKAPIPDEWKSYLPDEAWDYSTYTRKDWEVWVNMTYPKLGELLTCPVCLSRYVSVAVCMLLLLVLPVGVVNIIGVLFWPFVASQLLNKL